jgi:hypothetical protein
MRTECAILKLFSVLSFLSNRSDLDESEQIVTLSVHFQQNVKSIDQIDFICAFAPPQMCGNWIISFR